MFRFLHAADLHVDSPCRGLSDRPDAPLEKIRAAPRRALDNLVALAIEESVDFVVIAGDIFDGDWRDHKAGLFFHSRMVRLREAGIPVYLVSGNHDAASVITKKLTWPDNVNRFSTRTVETKEIPGLPVAVHGQGFPHRAVPENLALSYPNPIPGLFNLGLLHTSLNGEFAGHDLYAPCTAQDLKSKGYDYWALGHIHQPTVVSKEPWIVFPGNLQGRHVRETGPRGCCLITVDDALAVTEVVQRPLDVLRWAVVEVNLSGVEQESEAWDQARQILFQALEPVEERLLAVRVRWSGATPLHGSLLRRNEHWNAELLALTQDFGSEAVWLEKMETATSPCRDPAELAARDHLTRIVLETLAEASAHSDQLPTEVRKMLAVLPSDVRREIEDNISQQFPRILNDVQAIILEALAATGDPL